LKDIERTTGKGNRLFMRRRIRKTGIDQHKLRKTHGLHRPRCGADVAGVAGRDQDKA
jgi:hypothetical protein